MKSIITAAIVAASATAGQAQTIDYTIDYSKGYQPNAYGQGVGMDQYGRPVHTQPNTVITPNAYGPGTHSDQYGKPVKCYNLVSKVVCY